MKQVLLPRFAMLCYFELFFFSSNEQTAPGIQWQNSLGGAQADLGVDIKVTNDNGYIVGARSESHDGDVGNNYGANDFWIVKLNEKGNIEWEKNLGGNYDDYMHGILQTFDGGYAAAGTTWSFERDVTVNYGRDDGWIVKLDSAGDIEWKRNYGGSERDEIFSIAQTFDSGFIATGISDSRDYDLVDAPFFGKDDVWVIKLSATGNVEWSKRFGGSQVDGPSSIIQTNDSGYIFAADTYSNDGVVTGNHGAFDCWVVKLNKAGDIEWENCYGGKESDFANSIIQSRDGGYVFCASTNSNESDVSGNHGQTDYWVVKLNNTGKIIWSRCYGGSRTEDASSIQETIDNGFIIAGDTRSNDGDVDGIHLVSIPDYWIIKLDSLAELEWQKCLGGTSGDIGTAIAQASDGGYILTGGAFSDDKDVKNNNGYEDAWTVKLYPDVLPVSLLFFTATRKEKSVLLNWQTANEINNNYFVVERTAATNWQELGRINSKGNSSQVQVYSYEDPHPLRGQNLYRLKQVDKDGKFTYSKIVSASFENGIAIVVYPNPVKNILNIDGLDASVLNNLSIIDMKGNIAATANTKDAHYTWNVQTLSKGIYYLHIEANGKGSTIKFTKQ